MKYLIFLVLVLISFPALACSFIPIPGRNLEKENYDNAKLIVKLIVRSKENIQNDKIKVSPYNGLIEASEPTVLKAEVLSVIKNATNDKIIKEIQIAYSTGNSCDQYIRFDEEKILVLLQRPDKTSSYYLPGWIEQMLPKEVK